MMKLSLFIFLVSYFLHPTNSVNLDDKSPVGSGKDNGNVGIQSILEKEEISMEIKVKVLEEFNLMQKENIEFQNNI